jgi:hypothetical protein
VLSRRVAFDDADVTSRPPPTWLVALFTLSWFIPVEIGIEVADLQFNPMRVLGIFLLLYMLAMGSIRWAWPDLFALLFFVAVYISHASSSDAILASTTLGRLILDLGVAYLVGRGLALNPARFEWFLRFVIWCLAALSITLVIEAFSWVELHHTFWSMFTPVRGGPREERLGLMRVQAWARHPIMLGLTYASMLAVATCFALRGERSRPLLSKVLACGVALGVFCSLSSGSWTAGVVPLLLLAYDRIVQLPANRKWGLVAAGAVGIYAAIRIVSDNSPMMVILYRLQFSGGWWYRYNLWNRVMEVMPGHWWLGYGATPPEAFAGVAGWSVDNHYLATLLVFGRIGLWSWIAFNAAVVVYNIRYCWLAENSDLTRLGKAIGFTVIGLMVAAFSVALFSTGATMTWLVLGMAVGISQSVRAHASRRMRDVPKVQRPVRMVALSARACSIPCTSALDAR